MGKGRGMVSAFETPLAGVMDLIRHKLYATCQRRILEARVSPKDSAKIEALRALEGKLVQDLLGRGKWRVHLQFPNDYQPSLAARAWHDTTQWPGLVVLFDVLESHAKGMAKEYALSQIGLIRVPICFV